MSVSVSTALRISSTPGVTTTPQAPTVRHAPADSFSTAKKPASQPYDSTGLPNKVLKLGDHEAAVQHLQSALEKLGLMSSSQVATGPGWFGQRTLAALKSFQHAHHLPLTGVFDAKTHAAMHTALAAKSGGTHTTKTGGTHKTDPNALPKGVAAQYAFFKKFVAQHGGTFQTGPNRMNLIGLRKDDRAGAGQGQYHDTLYAAYTDAQGRPHVQRFTYTSEPARAWAWDAGDVNGDGKPDQGRIPAGDYRYEVSRRSNGAPCLRPLTSFRPQRDINHDGSFKENVRAGDGSVFLFHQGGYNGTGSAGCQTFSPPEWNKFWSTVSHAHGSLTYLLTTSVPKGA